MKIDLFSIGVGILVGIGAWSVASYLHTDNWVSAVRIFAQWIFPIVLGVGSMIFTNFVLSERKSGK